MILQYHTITSWYCYFPCNRIGKELKHTFSFFLITSQFPCVCVFSSYISFPILQALLNQSLRELCGCASMCVQESVWLLIEYISPVCLCAYVSSVSAAQAPEARRESQSSPALSLSSVSQGRLTWRARCHSALETSATFCQAFWSWIQQPWQPRHTEQIFASESFSYPHTRSFSFSSDRRMCSAAEHQMRWWIAQRHQGETKLCAESEVRGCQLETLNVANCGGETRLRDGSKICRSLLFLKLTSGSSRWRR